NPNDAPTFAIESGMAQIWQRQSGRRYCDLVYPAQAGNQRIFRNFRQPTQLKIKFPCALARKIARKLI
ncbi:hypothetical protein AAIH17_35330, partial [Pseudomonas aeruginosa]|uniref:hypothetical protein n=1 Tax=Pseudomonas aeruginosa TaxID=287 RepID=UPI0031B67D0E